MIRQFKWLPVFLAFFMVSCAKSSGGSGHLNRPNANSQNATPNNANAAKLQHQLMPPPPPDNNLVNTGAAKSLSPTLEQQQFQQTKLGDPIVPVAPAPDVASGPTILPAGPNDNQLLSTGLSNSSQDTSNAGGEACGESFLKNDPFWYPGLPYQPLQSPLRTGGLTEGNFKKADVQHDPNKGYQYTDAGRDGLLAFASDRINALSGCLNHNSKAFAIRIRGVELRRRAHTTEVEFRYVENAKGQATQVILSGEGRRNVRLVQIPTVHTHKIRFAGRLVCADQNAGDICQNYVMRLQHLNTTGRPDAIAYVLYREGAAHLTMSETDRRNFSAYPNESHSRFAKYLADTANNACLALLAGVDQGTHRLPDCAVMRLRQRCGGGHVAALAATSIDLKSWAVAYGDSQFTLQIKTGQRDALEVSGPLVYSKYRPMWYKKLSVDQNGELARYIKSVYLVANDGGGNLNLKFNFKGADSQGPMRLNISALNLNTDTQALAGAIQPISEEGLTCSQGMDVVVHKTTVQPIGNRVTVTHIPLPPVRSKTVVKKKIVKKAPVKKIVKRPVVHKKIEKKPVVIKKVQTKKVAPKKIVKHQTKKAPVKKVVHKKAAHKKVVKTTHHVRHRVVVKKVDDPNPFDALGNAINHVVTSIGDALTPKPEVKVKKAHHVVHHTTKHVAKKKVEAKSKTKKTEKKTKQSKTKHHILVKQVDAHPFAIEQQ